MISGILFSGNERLLLKRARASGIELVASEDVLEEVSKVIRHKFPVQMELAQEFVRLAEIQVIPRTAYVGLVEGRKVRDAADRHVLAAAIAAGCGFIVTGDKDLLSLKNSSGIEIISTSACLRLL